MKNDPHPYKVEDSVYDELIEKFSIGKKLRHGGRHHQNIIDKLNKDQKLYACLRTLDKNFLIYDVTDAYNYAKVSHRMVYGSYASTNLITLAEQQFLSYIKP